MDVGSGDRGNRPANQARPSAWTLLAVNALPLVGVWLWGWSVFDIVFLYWVENVVIGAVNVLRMAVCRGEGPPPARRPPRGQPRPGKVSRGGAIAHLGAKLFMIPFFIVHYGMFCFGHGEFLVALFADEAGADSLSGLLGDPRALLASGFGLAVGALALSHLVSFVTNFLLGGEYRRANVAQLMFRPYGRIVVMHLAILFGALVTEFFGSPVALLVLLVALKTAIDWRMHGAERRALGDAG